MPIPTDSGIVRKSFQDRGFGKFGFLDAGNRNFVFVDKGRELIKGREEAIAVKL